MKMLGNYYETHSPFNNDHPSVKEVLQSPKQLKGQTSMQVEINALEKDRTQRLIHLSNGKNIMSCIWVLTKKLMEMES